MRRFGVRIPTGSRKKLDCEQQSGFFLFGQSLSAAQVMEGRKKPGSRAADSSFMLVLATQLVFGHSGTGWGTLTKWTFY